LHNESKFQYYDNILLISGTGSAMNHVQLRLGQQSERQLQKLCSVAVWQLRIKKLGIQKEKYLGDSFYFTEQQQKYNPLSWKYR